MEKTAGKIRDILLSERYNLYFYCAVYMLSHLYEYYTGSFLKPLFFASYLWTLFLYVYNTVITKKYIKGPVFRNAQLFLLVNMVTTFMYRVNWRFSVLQDFAILVQYIFVFYGAFTSFDQMKSRTLAEKLMFGAMCLTGVITAASLIAVFSGSSLVWMQEKGVRANRQRGFYFETNEAACYAYTSIMFTCYFLCRDLGRKLLTKKKSLLYGFNILAQTVMIFLTGSRTMILVGVFTALYLLVRSVRRLKLNEKVPWLMRLIAAAAVIVLYVLVFTKYGFKRNLYYYMNRFPDFWSGSWEDKEYIFNKVMSGRYYLWKTSIQEWLRSPFFGFGLKSGNFNYTVYKSMTNSHNLFINTLLFSGAAGLAVLLRHFFLIFRNLKKEAGYPDYILFVYIFGNLAFSMLEVALLYNGKAVSAVFWAILGFLYLEKEKQPL